METGYRGTFVMAWSQTEVDGIGSPEIDTFNAGATWRWSGRAMRIDGPQDLLVLEEAEGMEELRHRAARSVARIGGARLADGGPEAFWNEDAEAGDSRFTITDGRRKYIGEIIPVPGSRDLLAMFRGALPPPQTEFWVMSLNLTPGFRRHRLALPQSLICFTPGTLIRTATGDRPVEEIVAGNHVQTKDNGLQEVVWTGGRRISGARLQAIPGLRPILIRPGALESGRPEAGMLVSPSHRFVMAGRDVERLFNTPEVLISAEDLADDRGVTRCNSVREVRYIHLLLAKHEIIWANGVETESFHPSMMPLAMVDRAQRMQLFDRHAVSGRRPAGLWPDGAPGSQPGRGDDPAARRPAALAGAGPQRRRLNRHAGAGIRRRPVDTIAPACISRLVPPR